MTPARAALAALCAIGCALAAACATPQPEPRVEAGPRIVDVRAGRLVGERELRAALVAAGYRLLGEMHDNPAHHAIRARLIAAIADAGLRPAVVFEPFDLEHDAALRAAQAAGADAERLADAGRLDRSAWRWPLHRPLVDAALNAGLPVRAGNLSRARLRAELASTASAPADASARFPGVRWTEAQHAALVADIVEGHCGKLPDAAVPRLVLAQRLRDAAMARALAEAATGDGAILVAGNGHVRHDLGVVPYLRASGSGGESARIVSVGLIELAADDRAASPRHLAADHPGFDYLWLTEPVARTDPCARVPATIGR